MGQTDKLFPAATAEDQEGIMAREHGEPIRLGTPAFSSPDPATESYRMTMPVTDDVTAGTAVQVVTGEEEVVAENGGDAEPVAEDEEATGDEPETKTTKKKS